MNQQHFQRYSSYMDQYKNDTLIYSFGDFDIYQDELDGYQFWKVYHEIIPLWQYSLKANGTGSVYLFEDGATSFMSGIIELKNNYDGKDEKLIAMIEKIIKVEQQNNEDLKIYQ